MDNHETATWVQIRNPGALPHVGPFPSPSLPLGKWPLSESCFYYFLSPLFLVLHYSFIAQPITTRYFCLPFQLHTIAIAVHVCFCDLLFLLHVRCLWLSRTGLQLWSVRPHSVALHRVPIPEVIIWSLINGAALAFKLFCSPQDLGRCLLTWG